MTYFMNEDINIIENELLRDPQIEAYKSLYKHFIENESKEHAIINLPTGTGKTGLMAIAPFNISKGKVLIITPQTVIRDGVIDSLDTLNPNNFWISTQVINNSQNLPSVIEYSKDITREVIDLSNIVILNIHKLQERLGSSLIRKVPKDYFDMIIIDEAHHSEAKTWKNAIKHFNNAKIIKVTGTPFRSDGKKIDGNLLYEYSLARAMSKGYVKSLEKFDYTPSKMYFTIDNNEEKFYSLEELRNTGIREENWIQRSVAMSEDSNKKIIELSLNRLKEKKELTDNPHKIIAVACSIKHAEQIKRLYKDIGYESSIVHSNLEKNEKETEFEKINNDKVEVVINVSMLGEGYDHKYLSIAAIFRPFKTLLPYAQFVGRVLRSIQGADKSFNEEDNTAYVIHHKELGLEELWEYYKSEIVKRDTIKKIKEDREFDISFGGESYKDLSVGNTYESEEYEIKKDSFVETELLKHRKEQQELEKKKIAELEELLNINTEEARNLYRQSLKGKEEKLLRPDKYLFQKRTDIDKMIKEECVPQLVVDFKMDIHGNDLLKNRNILPRKYTYIYDQVNDNGALLARYFNTYLKNELKKQRSEWTLEEYDTAYNLVKDLEQYIREVLSGE